MNEQDMIEDLIELSSDTTYLSQGKDEETIKKIKAKKEEKYDEIVKQINMICGLIEKDLKSQLGYEIDSNKVRRSVITTIKNELSNGNKIFKSNGKIDVGKLSDIVMQQKSKIKQQIIVENESDNEIISKNNSEITNQNENTFLDKKDFKGRMKDLDLDLSDEEMDNLYDAVSYGDQVLEEFKKYINSGLSENDAIKKMCEGKTEEEIEGIMSSLEAFIAVKVNESLQGQRNPESTEPLQSTSKEDMTEEKSPNKELLEASKKVIEKAAGRRNVSGKKYDNFLESVNNMGINKENPVGEAIMLASNLVISLRETYGDPINSNEAEKKAASSKWDILESMGALSTRPKPLSTIDGSQITDFQFDNYFGINSVDINVEQKREEHKPTTLTVSDEEYDIPTITQINIGENQEGNRKISNKEEFIGCLKQNNITNQDWISDIAELKDLYKKEDISNFLEEPE